MDLIQKTVRPRVVREGQTRLKGDNERIIALYARGMTTYAPGMTAREFRAHLREVYEELAE